MAINYNQYIGARYVPKFYKNDSGGNDWTENTAYEYLTIVQYDGASYTSTKDVPAGTGNPAENVEYWVKTTDYSAKINDMQSQLDSFESEINATNKNLKSAIFQKKIVVLSDIYLPENTQNINAAEWALLTIGINDYVVKQDTLENLITWVEGQAETDATVGEVYYIGVNKNTLLSGLHNLKQACSQKYPNASCFMVNYFTLTLGLSTNFYGWTPIYNAHCVTKTYKYFADDNLTKFTNFDVMAETLVQAMQTKHIDVIVSKTTKNGIALHTGNCATYEEFTLHYKNGVLLFNDPISISTSREFTPTSYPIQIPVNADGLFFGPTLIGFMRSRSAGPSTQAGNWPVLINHINKDNTNFINIYTPINTTIPNDEFVLMTQPIVFA